ncbi:MAG: alpha/beta hydrolase [Actinomycetota bacterium]
MSTTMSTITDRERSRIDVINESGRQPVVLIHGLWLLAGSWHAWEARLEESGFGVISIDWPGDPADVAAARANPADLAGTKVQDVVAKTEAVVDALERAPVLIGHSFGGLVAQIVAGTGLAAATIAIDPAPFKGILALPWSVLKSSFPVLGNPLNRRRAVTLTLEEFAYGFANALPDAEAASLYETYHVAAPGRPVFQAAFANLTLSRATRVDTRHEDRGPLLIVSGTADHTVPPSVANGAFTKQSKNAAVTELVEIDGAGHSLVIDHRWEEVAAATTAFLERTVPASVG